MHACRLINCFEIGAGAGRQKIQQIWIGHLYQESLCHLLAMDSWVLLQTASKCSRTLSRETPSRPRSSTPPDFPPPKAAGRSGRGVPVSDPVSCSAFYRGTRGPLAVASAPFFRRVESVGASWKGRQRCFSVWRNNFELYRRRTFVRLAERSRNMSARSPTWVLTCEAAIAESQLWHFCVF